jgi:hypothetical protein
MQEWASGPWLRGQRANMSKRFHGEMVGPAQSTWTANLLILCTTSYRKSGVKSVGFSLVVLEFTVFEE